MQFQVPQFIDIEDKIFGPFTFKQFVYIGGGAGICFVVYKLLPLLPAILIIVPVAALAASLAFYKINGKPFIFILQAYIKYFFQNKLYIWKKAKKQQVVDVVKKEEKKDEKAYTPKLTGSKLEDLSWSLDILDVSKKERSL
ncbi:MAG: PrgI family protein [Candidatus Paceibacterota bacterium]|jgi:hypothetical protein